MAVLDLKNRVEIHTSSEINARIEKKIQKSVLYYAHHPDQIENRIEELRKEWDVERALQANSAALSLFGLVFGIFGKRFWLLLPFAVLGFLMQHAVQGWCPPIELFRRLGMRTRDEIARELTSLMALRGEFDFLSELREKAPPYKAEEIFHKFAA